LLPSRLQPAGADDLDEVITGDLTGVLGYRTPAGGVVAHAVAPSGMRDRASAWPVAREHGTLYVLVQGNAAVSRTRPHPNSCPCGRCLGPGRTGRF
jgi:hypothetical protein